MLFRSRKGATATAVAEATSPEELADEIESLRATLANGPDSDAERRLLHLRHLAGISVQRNAAPVDGFVAPAANGFTEGVLPEIGPDELAAPTVRAAILTSGCVIVRGLVPRDDALQIAEDIELALQGWKAVEERREPDPGIFEAFRPERGFTTKERGWVNSGGGIWTADSPRLMYEVLETFDRTGLRALASEYLAEPALLSVQKGTLRKVPPTAGRGWHQDGAFMGDVKALNTWIALSHCGDDAPGMDLIPRRLDHHVETGTPGAWFEWAVAEDVAREAAGEAGVVRPIFEPGDVALFDELFLHTTAAEPTMEKHRYAIETWFFGASAFPEGYVPIAP